MVKKKLSSTFVKSIKTGKFLRNKIASFIGPLNTLGLESYAVLGFAMENLETSYTGIAFRIYDSVTTLEQDFYFASDGSFNFAAVDAWVTGTPLVTRWGNSLMEANYAAQTTVANMPTLDTTNECVVFDGSTSVMNITDYAGIQITASPLSMYVTYEKDATQTGAIFVRNVNDGASIQYAMYTTSGDTGAMFLEGSPRAAVDDLTGGGFKNGIGTWQGIAANETKYKNDNGENLATLNTTLNARTYINIGARHDLATTNANFFDGNLKTVIMFNAGNEVYDQYSNLVAAGL